MSQIKEDKNKEQQDKIIDQILQQKIYKKKEYKNLKEEIYDSEAQIERLLNKKYNNPYEILLLDMNATTEDIKQNRRYFMMSLHPNKTDNKNAKDAFNIVQQAYEVLQDEKKRKIYKRILGEAYNRTVFEFNQENKKREQRGQQLLTKEYFNSQLQLQQKQIFNEIEQKKNQLLQRDEKERLQRKQQIELLAYREQYKLLTEEEWDKNRKKRIQKWKEYKKRQKKIGEKFTDSSIRNIKH